MANRTYIYLKNGDEARILTEGIYTIPYFWQLFWDEEDLRAPIALWNYMMTLSVIFLQMSKTVMYSDLIF